MSKSVIQTNNLKFSYGDKVVLQDLSLNVPAGSIYGFLGPNGSGKTTTIKLLLGLLELKKQSVQIFGMPLPKKRLDVLQRIGSLVESPTVYGHLTAYENLEAANAFYNMPKTRITEVLDLMGLSSVINKKAETFSLGMIQRLGIALSLLPDPDLLILDEPVNGLDPKGIIDIRNLLLKLQREHGKTIFLSSHLLDEMEKIITHIGIIDNGKLLFQGTIEELNAIYGSSVRIKTSDSNITVKILQQSDITHFQQDHAETVIYIADEQSVAKLVKQLVDSGISVYSVVPLRKNLEEIFLEITSRKH